MGKPRLKNMSIEELEEQFEDFDEELTQDIQFWDEKIEEGSDKLLKEIKELPNGEERSRSIRDLEIMERITNERVKVRNENRKMKQELILKEEELKNQKKANRWGIGAQIIGTILSFVGYSILLDRQNQFESSENYSTQGSRGLTQNISHFVGRK